MKKYSLIWWFKFGNLDAKLGRTAFKHIDKKYAKAAYKFGYWVA